MKRTISFAIASASTAAATAAARSDPQLAAPDLQLVFFEFPSSP